MNRFATRWFATRWFASRWGRSARRGATFTFMVLAISTLILVSSGLLTRASRNTFEFSVEQARQIQRREACFAGVRWAAARASKVKQGAPAAERQAILSLEGAEVRVSFVARTGGGLSVSSLARGAAAQTRLSGVLVQRKQAWVLSEFTVTNGPLKSE